MLSTCSPNKLTVGGLFSGIGGFELGFVRAGFEVIWMVEIDEFCQKVLRKNAPDHWSNAKIYGDIKNVGKENLTPPDVIVGGFPCQPHSIAGKRKGTADDRDLWPEYRRIIAELRPAWVVGENVPGIRTTILDQVLSDLEGLGYSWQSFIIPACALNAPHRRDRVFIVAHAAGEQKYAKHKRPCGFSEQPGGTVEAGGEAFRQTHGQAGYNGFGGCGSTMAHASSKGLEGDSRGIPKRQRFTRPCPIVPRANDAGLGKTRPEQPATRATKCSEQQQNQWATEPGICRVVDGVPLELDLLGGLNEKKHNQKTNTENSRIEWEVLRKMWKHRELAKTSPGLYVDKLYDSLPEMSYGNPYEGWLLGTWIEKNKELRDLWEDFYSKSFAEAQDLQQILLERIRKIERSKEVGPSKNRTDRLRSLGNAVVPQVAEFIATLVIQAYNKSEVL